MGYAPSAMHTPEPPHPILPKAPPGPLALHGHGGPYLLPRTALIMASSGALAPLPTHNPRGLCVGRGVPPPGTPRAPGTRAGGAAALLRPVAHPLGWSQQRQRRGLNLHCVGSVTRATVPSLRKSVAASGGFAESRDRHGSSRSSSTSSTSSTRINRSFISSERGTSSSAASSRFSGSPETTGHSCSEGEAPGAPRECRTQAEESPLLEGEAGQSVPMPCPSEQQQGPQRSREGPSKRSWPSWQGVARAALLLAAASALPLAATLPRGVAFAETPAVAIAAGVGTGKGASEGEGLAGELALGEALSALGVPSMAEVEALGSLEEAAGTLERLRTARAHVLRAFERGQRVLVAQAVDARLTADDRKREREGAREQRRAAKAKEGKPAAGEADGALGKEGAAAVPSEDVVAVGEVSEEAAAARAPGKRPKGSKRGGEGGAAKPRKKASDSAAAATAAVRASAEEAGAVVAELDARIRVADQRARVLAGLSQEPLADAVLAAAGVVGEELHASLDGPGAALESGARVLRWVAGGGAPQPRQAPPGAEAPAEAAAAGGAGEVAEGVPAAVGTAPEAELGKEERRALSQWKRWLQAQRQELKQRAKEDPKFGEEWARHFEAGVLAARDRAVAQSWFDPREQRLEMAPEGLAEAVGAQLVASCQFRQDMRAAVVHLWGEPRPFFVRLGLWEALGAPGAGVQELRARLEADGVAISPELLPVPWAEWRPWDAVRLPVYAAAELGQRASRLGAVRSVLPWYLRTSREVVEEAFARIVFPRLPPSLKGFLKLDYSQGYAAGDEVAQERQEWVMGVERRLAQRDREDEEGWPWWVKLSARALVVGYPLQFLAPPVLSLLSGLLLAPPLPESEVQYKDRLGQRIVREQQGLFRFLPPGVGGGDKDKDDDMHLETVREAFKRIKRVRQPSIPLSDFAGMDAVKEEVAEVVAFLRDPKRFREIGAKAPRGVLITGPTGTGKTSLAMAIAAEAGVPVVEIREVDINPGGFVGQAASNVRELFQLARKRAPMIIFMENFETIGGVRGTTLNTKLQDKETLINQLLVELDGFETQEGVVLLAITDDPQLVDPALRRPGRMDRVIEVPMPNLSERETILRSAAARSMKAELREAVDWRLVAEQTPGWKAPELQRVPERITLSAVAHKPVDPDELAGITNWLELYSLAVPAFIRGLPPLQRWEQGIVDWLGLEVTPDDIRRAVPNIDFAGVSSAGGIEMFAPDMGKWDRDEKLPHAVWAAGRGVLAALLPGFDRVDSLWLNPTSWDGVGFTRLTRTSDGVMPLNLSSSQGGGPTATLRPLGGPMVVDSQGQRMPGGVAGGGVISRGGGYVCTRSYAEKQLVLLFGSHVAAAMLLPWGMSNNLATQQLLEACKLAEEMVLECGWGPQGSPMVYQAGAGGGRMPGALQDHDMEDVVRLTCKTALARATSILMRNRATLEAVVEQLCNQEALDGQALAQVMAETGAVKEEDPFELFPYLTPQERLERSSRALPESQVVKFLSTSV